MFFRHLKCATGLGHAIGFWPSSFACRSGSASPAIIRRLHARRRHVLPGDIRLEDVRAERRRGEVLLKVAAVGVCGSRHSAHAAPRARIACRSSADTSSPAISSTLGEGVRASRSASLSASHRSYPCRVCDQCLDRQFLALQDYDYFGSRRDGAYAEFVAAPVDNLLKTPKGARPARGRHDRPGLDRAARRVEGARSRGNAAAVIGCGPIGLFAIQWMKLMGCTEIVADRHLASRSSTRRAKPARPTTFLAHRDAAAGLVCDLIVEAAGRPCLDQSRGASGRARRPRRLSSASRSATCPLENKTFAAFSSPRGHRCTAPGIPSAPPSRARNGP